MTNCDLYDIWSKACNHYDIPEATIRLWYERVRTKLNEDASKRVYHNWSCMLAPKRKELENAKPHIVLAAFFQYYEFDLERNCAQDNCKIFIEFCQDGMIEDENMKQLVCRLLGEKSCAAVSGDLDYDMAFLQDLDLLILASTPDVYKNYAELSRKEWSTAGKTNFDMLRRKTPKNDEIPTTSRYCKEKISPKKTPSKYCGSKIKFKKVLDDQARRFVKRSVHLMNKHHRTVTILQVSPPRRTRKCLQKRHTNSRKLKNRKAKNVCSTLEDGEIHSSSSSEDDCVLVEPTLEEITLDDNDDEDFPITSDVSTSYQSLMESFTECASSTPCCKRVSATSAGDNTPKACHDVDIPTDSADTPAFFVDVGRGTESINSTDNFADYVKLTTLGERSRAPRRSVRLKEASNDEVIELDDTSNDNTDVTLKCNAAPKEDDSVIFISETNKNDFIPIVDATLPPNKILKRNEPSISTPTNRAPTNHLFTHSETKKLKAYNDNAYNPSSSDVLKTGKRMVIIDGSNVAFKHGLDQEFSVKGLQIAIEYFEKMGHEVKAVLPQYRMNRYKSSNQEELLKLHKAGKIVATPCKNLPGHTSTSYDDRFILQLAFATDAAVVSNDNYRDLLHENPAFRKIIENRVIGYTWCNDIFILPKDPYGKWGPSLQTILNRT